MGDPGDLSAERAKMAVLDARRQLFQVPQKMRKWMQMIWLPGWKDLYLKIHPAGI